MLEEKIIRTIEALLLSLLLHLLIALFFALNYTKIIRPPVVEEKTITLNLKTFVPPPPKPIVVPKPQPLIIPPLPPLPLVQKEPKVKTPPLPKQKLVDEKPRYFAQKSPKENNVTKKIKEIKKVKVVKVVKIKRKPKIKRVVKKVIPKKIYKERPVQRNASSSLGHALMNVKERFQPSTTPTTIGGRYTPPRTQTKTPAYVTKMINNLYGKEFNRYTPAQKEFIRKNLGTIHRITQKTLLRHGYPESAIRTLQEGTNIVSFYLHPNGDITELRLTKKIGYSTLDNNTLEVIRIAYKDYPLPQKRTKIQFYVTYTIE